MSEFGGFVASSMRVLSFLDTGVGSDYWGLRSIYGGQIAEHFENSIIQSFAAGAGVDVYVVDSGLSAKHKEFVDNPFSAQKPQVLFDGFGKDGVDILGHGSLVTSVIAGKSHGVAPGVNLFVLKVFDTVLVSPVDLLLKSLVRVREHIENKPLKNPSVVHLGFIVEANDAIDAEVRQLTKLGAICVCPAGQFGKDAKNFSPARLSEVITVGAHDQDGQAAKFRVEGLLEDFLAESNFGECIDIWAPGKDIEGAATSGTSAYSKMSGSSVATAYVTGTIACLLEQDRNQNLDSVRKKLLDSSYRGVSGLPLLFNPAQDLSPIWVHQNDPYLGVFEWGQDAKIQLKALSRVGEALEFRLVDGTLPPGLSIQAGGTIEGRIGEPADPRSKATSEYFSLVFSVHDSMGSSEQLFYLVVADPQIAQSSDFKDLELARASGSSGSGSCSSTS